MAARFTASIAAFLKRWRDRCWPSSPKHLRLGARGEKLAARHLRRHGFKILYRNFRGRTGGEIDLVCRERDTLVIPTSFFASMSLK